MNELKPDPVLRDPRRRKVNRLLGRAGPGVQQLYRDGCRVVDGQFALETAVNVIGNCMREIESAVRGVLAEITLEHTDVPPCGDRCARCNAKIRHLGQSHREEIEAILAALNINEPEIAKLWIFFATGSGMEDTGLASLTHRRGLEQARPLARAHKDTWRRLEDVFSVVLPHLEARFVELLPKYRALAAIASPTKADLKQFRRLPNTYRTRLEFFDNATPGWFSLLDDEGFFDQPEDAFAWEPLEGTLVPQHWPAIDYLVRMSKLPEHQDRFVAVFERLDPPHEWAVNDLVAAAGELPTATAKLCAEPLRKWTARQSYVFLAGKSIAAFAAKLAAGGESAIGGDLLRTLLALGPDPRAAETRTSEQEALFTPTPVTRLRDYDYEQAVKAGLLEFAKVDPGTALAVGLDLLSQALSYSERTGQASMHGDTSPWWRQSLEHDRGRYSHEAPNVLIDAVLESARARLASDPTAIAEVVSELEARRWTVFRRIALHLLVEYPDSALIRARLLDQALVEHGGTWPEFRKLLSINVGALSAEDQRQYVTNVEAHRGEGADPDFTGGAEHRDWVLRRLRPIAGQLPANVRERYSELAVGRAAREGTTDEVDVEMVGGWVGNKPQLTAEALQALSDGELLTHLRTWVPPGTFDGPNIEGQGDALRAAVVANPVRFAALAMSFQGLDYTYVRAIFAGLYDVLHAGSPATFDWRPVLDLASWVVMQPPVTARSSFSQDPDWSWTRKAIADLLHEGLGDAADAVPLDSADQVWSLIEALGDESDARPPRGHATVEEAADEEDALTAALNSTRGEALQAAISFVAWRWRHGGKPEGAISNSGPPSEFLARHLDHHQDPSLAARGVFGSRLAQLVGLDAGWVTRHLPQLFPEDDTLVRSLTWQAYIVWNIPYTGVRAVLSDEYHAAIGRLRARSRSRLDVGEKLAEHLLSFYLRGDIDLGSPDGLLATFYQRAPAPVRGQATEFAGRVLRNNAAVVTPEHCSRLRRLWDWRRSQVVSLLQDEQRAELEPFGWWFASDACDEDWLLRELIKTLEITGTIENDSLVMEKLAHVAAAHPDEVLHAAELMIDNPKERWQVQVWIDEIMAVIRATLGSPADARARKLGARLVADNFDNGLIELLAADGETPP